MAKDPAFLFYSQDFITGTQFFTDEQLGKYIRLLCAQHQHGHLSEEQVNYICRTLDPTIMKKFTQDTDGLFFNERLDNEIKKRKTFCNSRRENIKKRYKEKDTFISTTCVDHMNIHMENENENEIIEDRIRGLGKRKGGYEYPNLEQVKSYFLDNGYSEQSAVKAFNYYSVAGWKDSNGKQVRNWKQKMQSVWFKDENKKPSGSSSIVFPR